MWVESTPKSGSPLYRSYDCTRLAPCKTLFSFITQYSLKHTIPITHSRFILQGWYQMTNYTLVWLQGWYQMTNYTLVWLQGWYQMTNYTLVWLQGWCAQRLCPRAPLFVPWFLEMALLKFDLELWFSISGYDWQTTVGLSHNITCNGLWYRPIASLTVSVHDIISDIIF